jgi:threonylcarbamoyladenosine tRNA methylthiotransferase MtaB
MKIFLDMIGCRLNQSEIEGFANQFRALGHEIVADPVSADIAIINTCAVTVKAAADSRKSLRRAGRAGTPAVIATGCWATIEPEAARNLSGVTRVVGNEGKEDLVAELVNMTHDEISALHYHREPLPGDRARTRAFIKVQEGCDNRCTYCLTRLARGTSRSRSMPEIEKDVQAALDGGVKEIVLTGVQLGAWGRNFPEPQPLKDLIAAILAHPRIARVRLSSIEPWDFDQSMLSLWGDARLCRHLHIPLQSGSDRTLKRMGRPISMQEYQNLIDSIRNQIPEIAITTDVITGFPGESDADFETTLAVIQTIGFAGGHVFTYSPRSGTAAYHMDGQVPTRVAKARNAILRGEFKESGMCYNEGFLGQQLAVLWESSEQVEDGHWQLSGLTDNYIRVKSTAEVDLWNRISPVRLSMHHPDGGAIIGQIEGLFPVGNDASP